MPEESSTAPSEFDATQIAQALHALLLVLPENAPPLGILRPSQRTRLREQLREVAQRLSDLRVGLDPVRLPDTVFDPSDARSMGELIAKTLLGQERHPLATVPRFYGSGVYALYYRGDFAAYAPIRGTDTPLYVGKADPAVHHAADVVAQGERLVRRLAEHAKSLRAAQNLELEDFECRYLVVKSAWQNTAEAYLIQRFQPVWNNEVRICYGLGKHGDDPGTRSNQRSPWDTLHPGRSWAMREGNQPNVRSAEEILALIAKHYEQNHPEP